MTPEQHERAVEAAMAHRLTREGHCSYCTPHGTIEEGPAGATWTVECEHGGVRQQAARYVDAYFASLRDQGVRLVDLREVREALELAYHPQNPTHEHPADFIERRFGGNERSTE